MKYLLLTICTLFAWMVSAQNFYPPVVNYSAKDFGKERNPESYCVVQDHRGIMYFGNSHGILEFDGENWNFIQVKVGAFVRSLATDKAGVVYAGVYGDFGYLKPDETGQLAFNSLLDKLPEEDQFFSVIWNIHVIEDHVYFQSEEGLFDYDTKEDKVVAHYPKNTFHMSFVVDDQLILKERNVGLVTFDEGNFKILPGTDVFKDHGVFGVYSLEDDSLLIVTQELGLYKWKDTVAQLLPEENQVAMKDLGIFGSKKLSEGNFILNTLTNGAIVIDQKGEIVRWLNRKCGIRSNVVNNIYQDRDLNLWLALENGVSKVNYYSPLSFYDEKVGLEGNVESIIRFNQQIFVGTSFGLFTLKPGTLGNFRFETVDAIDGQVWEIKKANNKMVIAASSGLYESEDGVSFRKVLDDPCNTIIYREKRDDFIIGGANGIGHFTGTYRPLWVLDYNFSSFIGSEADPQNDSILWVGTPAFLIQLIEEEEGFAIDFFDHSSGMLDGVGRPIVFEDQLIFGGKDGLYGIESEEIRKAGLSEKELENPDNYRITFLKAALNDSIFEGQIFLLEKGEDKTWYCNDGKVGFFQHSNGAFTNRPFWGIDYGRINEFYLEENGVLWIGAADGVIRYEKNERKVYESEFYSLIRKAKLGKDSVIFNGVFLSDTANFSMMQDEGNIPYVPYADNDITFVFSAPYFEDEHQPEYRFLLEGYDEDWSEWGPKSEVSYNNMHEGDYVFQVEARNIYGQISQQARYSFVVLPPWYRTTWAFILYAIVFILILLIGVRISSLRLKAKNAKLEEIVEERTKEISLKNIVLEHQKQEIEDSINYAQRIQEAILPLETEMRRWIPESFILFRPKDIVSGDFYWFLEKDNKLIFICADCTGHGVPGAFMSMIGSDRLNNIVSERKITSPSAILSELNRAIKKSLKQDGEKESTRDGMDASICTIDLSTGILKYAGANRPLWIVQGEELIEVKATKVAVAGFTPDDQVYVEHDIPLKEGMKFYMTTDGYADQFGGERDKKYKVKRMKDFILQNSKKNFATQEKELERELLDWMGDTEQVDDVCVIGFEVNKG